MNTFIKKYWRIIVPQLLLIGWYVVSVHGKLNRHYVVYYLVYVAMLVLFAILNKRELKLAAGTIIVSQGNKLLIKGLFKRIEVEKGDIENFTIKTNFMALVFDWSQVVINTKTETIKIYTRKIKDANVSFT